MRALFCCLSMALTLTGCELIEQLLPIIIDHNPAPDPEPSESPTLGTHGQRLLTLPGGRLATALNLSLVTSRQAAITRF
jgi:hypothetical protein